MDPTHDRDTRAAADRPLHPVQVLPRPRRRPRIAAVALAVLLVAAAVSAGLSFRNGRAWERRAGQQAARADGAERRAAELSGQLDTSEATVDRLQGRLRDLADEKAQAVSDCRTALDDSQTLQRR